MVVTGAPGKPSNAELRRGWREAALHTDDRRVLADARAADAANAAAEEADIIAAGSRGASKVGHGGNRARQAFARTQWNGLKKNK